MPNTLQRYILKELAGPVLVSILFFSFIMLLRRLFTLAELLLEARVGFGVMAELLGIITLTLMILTVPMAALMGCLMGIGRLTADNEILAMRASGLSLFRCFVPVFYTALLCSGLLMYSGFELIPRLFNNLASRQTQIQFELLTNLEPGRAYENLAPRGAEISIYFEKTLPPKPNEKRAPYTLDMGNVAMRISARPSVLTGSKTNKEVTGQSERKTETVFFAERGKIVGDIKSRTVNLLLEDGLLERVDRAEPQHRTALRFGSLEQTLDPRGEDERDDAVDPRRMTLSELLSATATEPLVPFWVSEKENRVNGAWKVYLAIRNELYQRFTLPFSLLAFVIIGVPLAVQIRPTAKTMSFLIAMGLILFYYVMLTWANKLGGTNSPYTFLAFMSPNLILGGVGAFLFWKVQR